MDLGWRLEDTQAHREEGMSAEMVGDNGEELFAMGGRAELVQGVWGLLLIEIKFPIWGILIITSISIGIKSVTVAQGIIGCINIHIRSVSDLLQ